MALLYSYCAGITMLILLMVRLDDTDNKFSIPAIIRAYNSVTIVDIATGPLQDIVH